jgi:hypothetical protein
LNSRRLARRVHARDGMHTCAGLAIEENHREWFSSQTLTVGCLSILLLFPPGAGIGYLLAGDIGALWGAGIGVVLGVLLMAMLLRFLRRHR